MSRDGGNVRREKEPERGAGASWLAQKAPWFGLAVAAYCAPFGSAMSQQAPPARPSEVEFDPRFLSGPAVDLERFSSGNAVLPGVYALDVKVNGRRAGRYDVRYVASDGGRTEPCFTLGELEQMGVDTRRILEARSEGPGSVQPDSDPLNTEACLPLNTIVPQAYAVMDLGELALELSVPQAYVHTHVRGWVDPVRWNDGITAGLLDYSLNGYTSRARHGGSQFSNLFLGLTSGLNVGSWRLRQRSTKSWANNGSSSWNSLELFAQRGINPWRSQFLVGDSFTSGELFDSIGLRGVRLFSDDRMLPDTLRTYAPIVRGVAETNAIVTVRQAGRVIYEQNVPAGPFQLEDLPASGYGGDLDVTVQEADGRQSTFSVPFSTVPMLLREGVHRYSVGLGRYRNAESQSEPPVFEGTYQYGFTDGFTGYTGTQISSDYASIMLGAAINTKVGAFSLDVTGANTQIERESRKGISTRLNYSNILSTTGTRFSLVGYRYSTSNFYSLRDAIHAHDRYSNPDEPWYDYRLKQRLQVNVSQPVGSSGNVFIMASRQNYWSSRSGYDLQYQIGYGGSYRSLDYSIFGQRVRSGESATLSNQIMLTLSMPLGRNSAHTGPGFNTVSSTMTRSSNGDHQVQASVNGSGGADIPVSFGLTASTAETDSARTNSLGAFGSYRSPYGTYSASASASSQANQFAMGARGALVVHAGGVTAGPPLGRATALIQAKGAAGARVINGQGASIDSNGYALVPYLSPYRVNNVMLDPSKLGMEVELGATSEEVVPTLDSIVLVEFRTEQGKPVLLRLRRPDGEAVPLGAQVYQTDADRALGTVGQGGVALVRGLPDQGMLTIKWGDTPQEQCQAAYALSDGQAAASSGQTKNVSGLIRIQAECRTPFAAAADAPQAKEQS